MTLFANETPIRKKHGTCRMARIGSSYSDSHSSLERSLEVGGMNASSPHSQEIS